MLLLGLLIALAVPSTGQPVPDTSRAPSPAHRPSVFTSSVTGSALWTRGALRDAAGSRVGGIHVALEVRHARAAFGLEIMGSRMGGPKTVTRGEAEGAPIERTLSMTRVSAFGQFGPYFGPVRPFGELILGVNVLSSSIEGPGGEADRTAVAPAAGLGVGVEVRLPAAIEETIALPRTALRVEGRHVLGRPADYHAYAPDRAAASTRSSSTTVSSFSVGLTLNF